MPDELPIVLFAAPAEMEAWLDEHAGSAEALEVALCFGWIDSQKKGFDEKHFLQRFTPRRPRGREFFSQLASANRYAIVYRLGEAKKKETRERRLRKLVEMLERGERVHG